MPRASVITGKATAPPPSLVMPAHGQTCKQCLTMGPKMIMGLSRNDGISYEQPLVNIYCSVTCYGGSEHHGDGEQVPVREVGEVVMLERLT